MKELKGEFSIGRVSSSHGDDHIRIEVQDSKSRARLMQVRMTPDQFGRAITGLHLGVHDAVEVDFNDIGIAGTRAQHKTEHVFVPVGTFGRTRGRNDPAFIEAARKLLRDYEVEGWRARYGDLLNGRNVVAQLQGEGQTYKVVFFRQVRDDGTPWYRGVEIDDFLHAACDDGLIDDVLLHKLVLFNHYLQETRGND